MDKSFTEYIRTTVENDGKYVGPLFLESEVDALFDWPEESNPSLPTDAAEELIIRTSGITVDLAPQNAAVLAIGKSGATATSSYNAIAVRDTEGVKRTYSKTHKDTKHITPITSDDANEAVRSISFPQSRPSGTPLDGLRLDMRDNPAESCLSNALTTVQFLKLTGADVSDLCNVIDKIFGINYSKKLIETSAFAAAEDIETFIASGGRPAPATYVSPNIMTRYVAYHTPRYDAASLNTSSVFMGRCVELAKFVSAFTNFVHGRKYKTDFCFEVNPSGFSKFNPGALEDYACNIDESGRLNRLSSTIPAKRSYDTFVKSRQPARVALIAEKKSIIDTMDAIKMSMPTLEWKDTFLFGTPNELMTGKVQAKVVPNTVTSESDPKRVSARFLHYAHKDHSKTDPHKILHMTAAVAGFNTFAAIGCDTSSSIASYWKDSYATAEFKAAMDHIDTVACWSIKELHAPMQNATNPARTAQVWLAIRHVLHTRTAVRSAHTAISGSKSPRDFPSKMNHRSDLFLGKTLRLYKAIEVYLQIISKTDPYKSRTALNASAHKSRYGVSLLTTSTGMLASIEESWLRWDKAKAAIKSQGKDIGGLRAKKAARTEANFKMKHVFANCRSKWVDYYCRKFRFIKKQIVTLSDITGCGINSLVKYYGPGYSSDSDLKNLASGLVMELFIEMGKALAFRFYHVTTPGLPMGSTIADSVDKYRAWITAAGSGDVSKLISIDSKHEQSKRNSALNDAIDTCLAEALTKDQCGEAAYDKARGTILDSYKRSGALVHRAFSESLDIDRSLITQGTVDCKPAPRVSKWETKAMTSARSKGQTLDVASLDIFANLTEDPIVMEAKGGIKLGLKVAGDHDKDLRRKLEFIVASGEMTAETVKAHDAQFKDLARRLDLADQIGPGGIPSVIFKKQLDFIDMMYSTLGGPSTAAAVLMQS